MAEKFAANQMLCPKCGDGLDLEVDDLKTGSFVCPTCDRPLSLSDFYDFRLEVTTDKMIKRHSRARRFLGILMVIVNIFSWVLLDESADIPVVSWLTTLGSVVLTTMTVVVVWALWNLPYPRFTPENCAELRSIALEKRDFQRRRLRSNKNDD